MSCAERRQCRTRGAGMLGRSLRRPPTIHLLQGSGRRRGLHRKDTGAWIRLQIRSSESLPHLFQALPLHRRPRALAQASSSIRQALGWRVSTAAEALRHRQTKAYHHQLPVTHMTASHQLAAQSLLGPLVGRRHPHPCPHSRLVFQHHTTCRYE